MVFDITMTIFFGIEFWRVSGQAFFMDFKMVGEVLLRLPAGVGPRSVPNQNDGAGNMVSEMLQGLNDLLATDCSFKMPFVDFAREGEGHRRGQRPAIRSDLAQDRSTSSTSPRGRGYFLKGKSKFIPKDDFCAQPLRLFLSWVSRARARLAPTRVLVLPPAAAVSADCIPSASRAG